LSQSKSGGTTAARFDRRGREMMPIFLKGPVVCMDG
jgi:hypothetical protein